jgi:hypothetical protein
MSRKRGNYIYGRKKQKPRVFLLLNVFEAASGRQRHDKNRKEKKAKLEDV